MLNECNLAKVNAKYRNKKPTVSKTQKGLKLKKESNILVPQKGEDGYGHSQKYGFAFVIDGATSLNKNESFTAKQMVLELTNELNDRLRNKNKNIPEILKESINEINKKAIVFFGEYDEKNGPSAAITIVRLKKDKLEYYSLGDCMLSIKYKRGNITTHINKDIVKLDNQVLAHMEALAIKEGCVRNAAALPIIQEELLINRNLKNKRGGYWIFDLTGEGISHGVYKVFDSNKIESLVLMSDGIIDLYKDAQQTKFIHEWLIDNPESAVHYLMKEYENDIFWNKYPRFKKIDDITIMGLSIV